MSTTEHRNAPLPDEHYGSLPLATLEAPAPPGGGDPAEPGGDQGSLSPRLAFLRLAVVVAAIVVVFAVTGNVGLLIVIAAIIVMVMVHELGHFATAKWSRMLVTQYFVGFGPTLWSVRRGETEYGVKAIPAGGFVKIPGMTNLEDVDPALEARTYRQQPFSNRLMVAFAGSFMHFVMALVLAWVAIVAFGVPSNDGVRISGFVTWPGHVQNAAQQGGLRSGDVVVGVDGRPLTDPTQLTDKIRASAGTPVQLTVLRNGATIHLEVTPAKGHVDETTGVETLGGSGGQQVGLLGINLGTYLSPEGPFRAIGTAGSTLGSITAATASGLAHVFSPHGLSSLFDQVTNTQAADKAAANPASSDRVSSIVGGVRVATQAEKAGVYDLLLILIALNIVLGIFNLFPMLPLDGGHVAIALYERARTRKGQPYYQADAAKLLPVIYVFVALLVAVVVAAMFLDIAHPAANPFR